MGKAYCWGNNVTGRLGDGTMSTAIDRPDSRRLFFSSVATEEVTAVDCHNRRRLLLGEAIGLGELGDRSTLSRPAPALVSGGLTSPCHRSRRSPHLWHRDWWSGVLLGVWKRTASSALRCFGEVPFPRLAICLHLDHRGSASHVRTPPARVRPIAGARTVAGGLVPAQGWTLTSGYPWPTASR